VHAWSAAVAAVLVSAAAVGCSSGGSAGSGGTADGASMPIVTGLETTNLTVYDYPAIDDVGLYIAQDEGLFQKEGLHVTLVPDFKSSQDTIDAIESGKGQISGGDYVTYMNDLVGPDPNLEIIGEGSVLRPNVLVMMTSANSKITHLSQVKGQAIPVSGIHDIASLLVDSVLRDNDVPIDSVHYVPNIVIPGVPAMLAKGVFQTGVVPEPFVSQGEQQDGDVVLADLDQGATSDFPILGYSVTSQWARQHPNTLKAFATALDEGQEIADTSRPEVEKALEGQPLKVPVGVASVISLPDFPPGVDPARLQRVMSDMVEFDFFKGQQLTTAKQFQVKNVVYAANVANANGQASLLGG
jgi:NitT/TauT family transport system substrate-binding protein